MKPAKAGRPAKPGPRAAKFTEASPMTCLCCVHCRLLPHSNLGDAFVGEGEKKAPNETLTIPIYCEKAKRPLPARIWVACDLADGRIRNATMTRAKQAISGDRSSYVTPVERIFLQLHYFDAALDDLRRCTLRDSKSLGKLGRRYGIARAKFRVLEGIRQGTAKTRAKVTGPRFNDEQRAYIQQCLKENFWPQRGGEANTQIKARNQEIRAAIVAKISTLGTAFDWKAIGRHAIHEQPGAKRWREQWSAAHRRKSGGYVEQAQSDEVSR